MKANSQSSQNRPRRTDLLLRGAAVKHAGATVDTTRRAARPQPRKPIAGPLDATRGGTREGSLDAASRDTRAGMTPDILGLAASRRNGKAPVGVVVSPHLTTPRAPSNRIARKRLGKFYTPDQVAQALTDWAIRTPADRVLDPSYGGCAFFSSALSRLRVLGVEAGAAQLFGVDIDPEAATHLQRALGANASSANFRTADFLDVDVTVFEGPLEAVVGNPPYVRHHALTSDQLAVARRRVRTLGHELDGRADYWAYFVLNALSFIAAGGRLAMVLPVSLLNADYAAPVRTALARAFGCLRLALVRERIFAATDEAALIVLGDRLGDGPASSTITVLEDAADVPRWCAGGSYRESRFSLSEDMGSWRRHLIGSSVAETIHHVLLHPSVRSLDELARVSIGTVTGANRFFILDENEAYAHQLPDSTLGWVLSSSRMLTGLEVSMEDLVSARERGERVLLFLPGTSVRSKRASAYIGSPDGVRAQGSAHCKRRTPWYKLTDTTAPDAFLTYVNDEAPRLVLNAAAVPCTNAIHRVWWRSTLTPTEKRALALSFFTTLSAVSAELQGRSYGGGALKLEPREARAVRVAVPTALGARVVDTAFAVVSRLIRTGDLAGARKHADKVVLATGLGLTAQQIEALRQAQLELQRLRHG